MQHFYRALLVSIFIMFSAPGQTADKLSPAFAQRLARISGEETIAVWIYFIDKGRELSKRAEDIEATLTERAYHRRLRTRGAGRLVDAYDVPVAPEYVREVAGHVTRIRTRSRWLNAVSAVLRKTDVAALQQLPFVRKIDLVRRYRSPRVEVRQAGAALEKTGGTFSFDYGPSEAQNLQINVTALHEQGFTGSGVLVAMLDAGFNNLQHEALQHLNIVATWDFVNGDPVVSDEPGQMGNGNHGTYTLSALAGFKEGQLIGPAYGADFILAKTENTDYERHIEEDHWVAAAEWADSLGADIISSSLGYLNFFDGGEPQYTWEDMDGNTAAVTIGADIAASRGILVVNAVGNEGVPVPPVQNTIIAPADGDSVLAVGAVDATGTVAGFSSRGPTADGRIKPDVMARGVQTYCASPAKPNGYVSINGTSLSCPLVAGAAALVLQANPGMTNMQIIDALRSTASNASAPDNHMGWGIIDALAAASYIVMDDPGTLPNDFQLYPPYPNPFNPSTTIRYFLPERRELSLSVYNLLGQRVAVLFEGVRNRGEYRQVWNAGVAPSGVYFIVMQTGEQRKVQKAILLR